MIRALNYLLLSLQAAGCGLLLLVSWSELTSQTRNAESGMFFGIVGLPISLFSLAVYGWIYWLRSDLPERFRERILMTSAAMMLLTVVPSVFGLMGG